MLAGNSVARQRRWAGVSKPYFSAQLLCLSRLCQCLSHLIGKTELQIDLANTCQGHNNMGNRAKREDGSTSSREIMPETAQPTSNWHGAYFAPSSPSTAISSSPLLRGFCPAYMKLALQSRKDVVYQAELPISSTSTTHRSSRLQSALAARGGSKDSQSE